MRADDWLSQVLGMPAFSLGLPLPAAPALAAELACLPREAFCSAKLPVAEVAAVGALEGAGFRLVDTALTFERGPEPAPEAARAEVRPAQQAERDAVLDIAGSSFCFSRFHQDPRIPLQVAHDVKRAWAANCLDGKRGEEVLVALDRGRPAGFLAVLADRGVVVIDLVAVAAQSQGRGIGAALVGAFIARWRGRAPRLRVGTQAANVPSVRLYERCGFRFVGGASVLHLHRRGGRMA
jgi:GNAT superfamily N-acetyltransferase